jgi:membrane protein required for colicin V production
VHIATLDIVLVVIVAVSALIGLVRGLVREAMSLVVWVVAVWAAARYADLLSPELAQSVPNAQLRLWLARGVLLVGLLLAGALVTWAIAKALHSTGLGPADRIVGLAFGVARGLVVVGIVVIVLRLAGFSDEPWWRQSKLIPYAAPVADALREAAERGLERWSLTASGPSPRIAVPSNFGS